jgi:regulator of protease activity HflC (stomatin/prohibitin superfamily)
MTAITFGVILVIVSFALRAASKEVGGIDKMQPAIVLMRIFGVIAIVAGVILSTVTIVPAGYRAVLMNFGAVKGSLNEGLNFIVPGINTVELMEVRTQKEESQATAASRDLQIVTTSLALNFRIDPAMVPKVYQTLGLRYKERIIDPVVQESIKAITAQYTAEDLIRKRTEVKNLVEDQITDRLKPYGILVAPSGVSITNFNFSDEFNKAIEQKQVAQQEAEKQKYLLQRAEMEKQTEVARAEGKSQAAKLNAEALKVQGGALVIAREWIDKWDGKLPNVNAGGGGSAGGFIIDISALMKASQ